MTLISRDNLPTEIIEPLHTITSLYNILRFFMAVKMITLNSQIKNCDTFLIFA